MPPKPATQKQNSAILTMARKLDGGSYRFVEQCAHLLPISSRVARGLTRDDATLCIEHLQAELDKAELAREAAERGEPAAPEPTPAPAPEAVEGAPSAEDVLAMVGKKVTVTFAGRDGDPITWDGRCQSITANEKDGTPQLQIITAGRTRHVQAHRLTSWVIH